MVLSDLERVCIRVPTLSTRCGVGISRSKRDLPPADYLFKIQSYSLSMDKKMEKYESSVFQAGGYTWKLVLYPNGNSKRNGKGHISLYLAITDTEILSRGWEVNVNFKLFVFDHNCNNYLIIQDGDGAVRKFNEMKTEWGYDKLISLEALFDSCNGYLVDDLCVFGAEVFVIGNSCKRETISLKPSNFDSFSCKIENFSALSSVLYLRTSTITVGVRKWVLMVSTKQSDADGNSGKHLVAFLMLKDWKSIPAYTKVKGNVKFKLLDQLQNKYHEKTAIIDFSVSNLWTVTNFITISELNRADNPYTREDAIIVEVEISDICIV